MSMSQTAHSLSDSDLSDYESENIGVINDMVIGSCPSVSHDFEQVIKYSKKQKNIRSSKAEILAKKKAKDDLKYILPATCLNYVTICVDKNISTNPRFENVISELKSTFNLKIVTGEQDSISWTRDAFGECKNETHILILWDHIKLLSNVENCSVLPYFSDLKKQKPHHRIYLAIYGLRDYCKRLRSKTKLLFDEMKIQIKPSKDLIENIMCEVQLTMNISHRLFDDPNELNLFISQLTKSVAECPYRSEQEKNELEKTWFIQGNSRNCVAIDKGNNGMKRLWEQQLSVLPKSSLDYAKGISKVYPSPYALYKAFISVHSSERETMLQNIAIGRENSKKRVGPEMSKKISQLFASKYDFN